MKSLGFFIVLSSAKCKWTSSITICTHFISFICLIALKLQDLYLMKESGYLFPIPACSTKALGFSQLSVMLAMDLLYIVFVILRYISHIPRLSKTFIQRDIRFFSKVFSISNERWFVSFTLFIW